MQDQGIAKTGVPYTDSAYGSFPYPNDSANVEHSELRHENAGEENNAEDNVTTYSATATVTPHLAHGSISELSNDLHSRFGQCPLSRFTTDSTDASFESDLFSDSDSLEDVGPLDRNDENFSILDSVVQTLLSGFRETSEARKRLGQSETSSGSAPGSFNPATELLSTALPLKSRRKRQRGQDDEEGSENED